MRTRLAKWVLWLTGPFLVASWCGPVAGQEATAEHVKNVRAAYQQMPPLVLRFKDPLRVTGYDDELAKAISLHVEDGDATIHEFNWWLDKGKSPNREYDRIYWTYYGPTGAQRGPFRLAIRGPEEAALYGLLLRYLATEEKKDTLNPVQKSRLEGVKKLLARLDQRFAGEKPLLQK